MDSLLHGITSAIPMLKGTLLQGTGQGDLYMYGLGALVVVFAIMKIAFYTIKRVVVHLALAYVAIYGVEGVFHIGVDSSPLMMTLMALFGPIPVIAAALWHVIM